MTGKVVVLVSRARELLGEEVAHLSDQEISQLIATQMRLSRVWLEMLSLKLLGKSLEEEVEDAE